MSLITRNNYEVYLLDYVEENLSPELIAELMLFLEKNLDLKTELDEFEIHELVPSKITLADKTNLKKNEGFVTTSNYEDIIIAEVEGENSKKISEELHQFLAENPTKQADFIVYQKTRLVGSVIFFNHKGELKKRERKVIPMYWWYSSAAAIVLILFMLKGLNNDAKKEISPIAKNLKIEKDEINRTEDDSVFEEKENKIKKNVVADVNLANRVKVSVPNVNKKEPSEPTLFAEEKDPIIEKVTKNLDDEKLDSIPINKDDLEEEILYTDNVTITYDDEEKDVVEVIQAPISRFKIIREILNQRVKKKFLQQERNKNGEVTAYALNVAGVGFSKNRKNNKR